MAAPCFSGLAVDEPRGLTMSARGVIGSAVAIWALALGLTVRAHQPNSHKGKGWETFTDTIIRAVQKKVGIFVDGSPGPATWGAIHLAVVGQKPPGEIKTAQTPTLTGEGKKADSRSEGNIATLLPRVRPFARASVPQTTWLNVLQ